MHNDNDQGITMQYMHRAARTATLVAACALLWATPTGGRAAGQAPPAPAPAPGASPARDAGFEADRHACQSMLGGRLSQRRQVAATHPRVAACLQRRGWASDGTPLLVPLVAPG